MPAGSQLAGAALCIACNCAPEAGNSLLSRGGLPGYRRSKAAAACARRSRVTFPDLLLVGFPNFRRATVRRIVSCAQLTAALSILTQCIAGLGISEASCSHRVRESKREYYLKGKGEA